MLLLWSCSCKRLGFHARVKAVSFSDYTSLDFQALVQQSMLLGITRDTVFALKARI